MSIRSRLLNRCFNLLYGPLVFLHDPAGACLFGHSWDGRRAILLSRLDKPGRVLDVGCGGGRLLAHARRLSIPAVGVDPSLPMLLKARRMQLPVVRARAEAMPLANGVFDSIIVTYPGPWIRQPAVWAEFARVLRPGGSILVLLGGTVERGRGSKVRSLVSKVLYGPAAPDRIRFDPPLADDRSLQGALDISEDEWGTVFYWSGTQVGHH